MPKVEKAPNKPNSLTKERVKGFLPKLVKCGKFSRLRWPSTKNITENEAKYILQLDLLYTSGELAAVLLGTADISSGMQIVALAEKRMGDNYIARMASDKNNTEKPEEENNGEEAKDDGIRPDISNS